MNAQEKSRFLAKVDVTDVCWNWTAFRDKDGYGYFKIKNKMRPAHRVVYEHVHGAIPESMEVCHHCDNTGCVNPKHLFLGTRTDNMRDAATKNRMQKGEKRPNSVLTKEIVAEVKAGGSVKELSTKYGVNRNTLYNVKSGRTWSHI